MTSDDPSDYAGMENAADLPQSDSPDGEEDEARDDSAELEEFGSLLSVADRKSRKRPVGVLVSEETPAANAPPSHAEGTSGRSHWRAQIALSEQPEDEDDSSIVTRLRRILGWARR
jgi:hypothetical protein